MADPLRLAVVEDHADLRRHLAARLAFFPEVALLYSFGTAEALLATLATTPPEAHPHVVLMDIGLPGQSGIAATEALRAQHPHVDVLMLTVFEDVDHLLQAIRAGASGYLLKDVRTEALVAAVCELHTGGAPMTPRMARRILQFVQHTPPEEATDAAPSPGEWGLSAREAEVLHLLVDDASYDDIAAALFISPHTVRSHVKQIFRKLHVSNRAAAVREAFQRRLV